MRAGFGVIEYVCDYLIFSVVLLACTIVIGNAFHKLQRFKSRSDARDIARWN